MHICTPNEKTVVIPERPPKDGYEAFLMEPAGTHNVKKAASAGSRRDRTYGHDQKDAAFAAQWDAAVKRRTAFLS